MSLGKLNSCNYLFNYTCFKINEIIDYQLKEVYLNKILWEYDNMAKDEYINMEEVRLIKFNNFPRRFNQTNRK